MVAMTAVAGITDTAKPDTRPRRRRLEIIFAVAAFAVLCLLVLKSSPYEPEPDDHAYQASIVAVTEGHFFTLSSAQARSLAEQTTPGIANGGPVPGGGPVQWVQLADGRWISEKDPGYPYLAAPFQELGIIRLAPLFYGALACIGLFFGGRRWLGSYGGTAAVGLYCSSGAALLFAWRDYMPTFTDASLIAAGTGALLWSVLATEASTRRRTWIGLAGFIALEAATFTRYTDVVVLGCAVVAVLLAGRLQSVRLPGRVLAWWLASVAVFGAGVAIFDSLIYGGPLKTGYRPGEIRFTLSSIGPNLRYMPGHLIEAMPMLVLGLAGLAGIVWLRLSRRSDAGAAVQARRDLWVGLALFACWLAVWGLYSAYSWTAAPGLSTLQSVRFYVPALGAISLLGAWLLVRVPGLAGRPPVTAIACVAAVAVLFGLGAWSFSDMYAHPMGGGIVVVHGPGGVRVHPGPGVQVGPPSGPKRPKPGGFRVKQAVGSPAPASQAS